MKRLTACVISIVIIFYNYYTIRYIIYLINTQDIYILESAYVVFTSLEGEGTLSLYSVACN